MINKYNKNKKDHKVKYQYKPQNHLYFSMILYTHIQYKQVKFIYYNNKIPKLNIIDRKTLNIMKYNITITSKIWEYTPIIQSKKDISKPKNYTKSTTKNIPKQMNKHQKLKNKNMEINPNEWKPSINRRKQQITNKFIIILPNDLNIIDKTQKSFNLK